MNSPYREPSPVPPISSEEEVEKKIHCWKMGDVALQWTEGESACLLTVIAGNGETTVVTLSYKRAEALQEALGRAQEDLVR